MNLFHREAGAGAPVVFLHGNPTSSYLWRNVMPLLPGRRLAPDLIGMGDSPRLSSDYSFDDHARHLDEWFDALSLEDVVLVGHDWGGALAADWASRHPSRVRGLAFTEAVLKPMTWEEFPPVGAAVFRAFKAGESLIPEFLASLPAEYARLYPTEESRIPLLRWARSMPLGGSPADVVSRIEAFDGWLASSPEVPKLLITFEPAFDTMLTPPMIEWMAETFASLEVVHHPVAAGHHTPEEQPELLASTLAAWLARIPANGTVVHETPRRSEIVGPPR
ncbi:alpha/beta fold hydrolase [Amycolatopsis sp. OK19-0408]|uniref:Alpha/beta fold hydrolase n=1 Tax=Amycolatopsis iheyensis TaxID=2945988 RepID=A0A9X2N9I8_9PSEU|nr:alpha/beta fold hydrolase [Amycolatopsis iheyensis]MCR6483448.1 alpha/beta fold hydrolase [Amycolatopsis iheyensis]